MTLLAWALAFTQPTALAGQFPTRAAVRDTVRITGAYRQEMIGVMIMTRRDSVAIQSFATPDTTWIPTSEMRAFDVGRGRETYAMKGARIGAGIGLAAGLALGAILGPSKDVCLGLADQHCKSGPAVSAVAAAGIGGPIGILVGGIIGAHTSGPKWQRITLEDIQISRRRNVSAATVGLGLR